MKLLIVSLVVSVGAIVGCSSAPEQTGSLAEGIAGGNEHLRGMSKATAGPTPLIDHNGPVLTASNTYAIFWGTGGFPSDEVAGVETLLGGLNGTSYLGIADQYMRGGGATTSYQGATYVASAPPSHAPKASDLGKEVCSLFGTPDPNGIYFFFTNNFPHVSYCAWHAGASCNGVTFQVGYMPNMQGVSGCSPTKTTMLSCNGLSAGTVSLLDGLAHEFMEATTDPQISAWYDKNGQEIGDKCNFVYGGCVQLNDPSKTQVLLQQEWSNSANGCVDQ
jgi:hypothetical protein